MVSCLQIFKGHLKYTFGENDELKRKLEEENDTNIRYEQDPEKQPRNVDVLIYGQVDNVLVCYERIIYSLPILLEIEQHMASNDVYERLRNPNYRRLIKANKPDRGSTRNKDVMILKTPEGNVAELYRAYQELSLQHIEIPRRSRVPQSYQM